MNLNNMKLRTNYYYYTDNYRIINYNFIVRFGTIFIKKYYSSIITFAPNFNIIITNMNHKIVKCNI